MPIVSSHHSSLRILENLCTSSFAPATRFVVTNVCTHALTQLKNMISTLFQSRPAKRGGTRAFKVGNVTFGWSIIEDMYSREVSRIQASQCSRVPKLKKSYIIRDSWTRLNVLPSKVMQVIISVQVMHHFAILIYF